MRLLRLVPPLLLLSLACGDGRVSPAPRDPAVLVFSRTLGFRHASIEAGQAAIATMGESAGFTVHVSEDPAWFTDAELARVDAVVFLNTTGDVLNADQQAAFERFIQGGGGYVGVHSAADTEYDWPWYGALVGAYFASHPAIQEASVNRVVSHPSTVALPNPWVRTDEWYNFAAQPVGVTVLLTLNEASYTGGTMGATHPITWYHEYDGGRAFYSGMGHTAESYGEGQFLGLLRGAILWALGAP
jgi:type 1 glutamine amidotransferase